MGDGKRLTWDDARARAALRALFRRRRDRLRPTSRVLLAAHLPAKPVGAAIALSSEAANRRLLMAAALEDARPDVALEGTVVTRYGARGSDPPY